MRCFTVTRVSGEVGGPGEFCVEDSNGVEWQVTAVPSEKHPDAITSLYEVVCMSDGYECGWELRGEMFDAVRSFVSKEVVPNANEG